jgi:hypothetical protein
MLILSAAAAAAAAVVRVMCAQILVGVLEVAHLFVGTQLISVFGHQLFSGARFVSCIVAGGNLSTRLDGELLRRCAPGQFYSA